ncbi:NAD(P)/FAD-dependent oxidoreductase [Phyllobacterium endophyticum]|uniref:FAD-binding oxidoreductase n=1 Tax=Phyllobacterium endophyticum TaxID=1149773 RepID=A0A2P7AKE6_9HYPH|nr:FAD-dependent oxidoreductase [Phyllobacterium endophyticum]MBB3237082.1 D-amino-acid dehydrogenase [Phyllobacterium endophyticum]PSH54681.1 FAD-binding oxidoreductase [Phyllobacterium endophyticum]TYR40552.1 FAD-dependent oxidoreductase [Phyllobacterium endophyticum]
MSKLIDSALVRTPPSIVIGAGIAGACAAAFLQRAGESVVVLDPLPGTGGASFGNAGIVSADTAVPIALPGMIWNVPKWLIDPLSPLSVRAAYLPQATPWLARWIRAGMMDRVEPISRAIRNLHREVWSVYRELLGDSFDDLLRPFGHVQLFEGTRESRTASIERLIRKRREIEAHDLTAAELREMFPGLSGERMRGIMIPGNGHTVNPSRLVLSIAEKARQAGVEFRAEKALKLIPESNGGWLVMTNCGTHVAKRVVVTAGAWSGELLEPLGIDLPLDTERGYHAMFKDPGMTVPFTILHKDWGMSISPTECGLCASGTVEIAGLRAPPNEARARVLVTKAKRLFPDLSTESRSFWIGFRPSFPDSLPVVGPSRKFGNLFFLFGHGHYGMTGGPTGAKLLAQLIVGRAPFIDPAPYSASRFGQ